MQRRVGQVSDVRAHPGDREPAARVGSGRKITTAAPFRVGHHGLAADLVESDVLRRVTGRGGEWQGRKDSLRVARCPLQHLHPAHRASGHGKQRFDAEMVEQHRLGADHVAHCDHRKVQAPGLAGPRIGRSRTGGSHAGAQHVGADHEVAVGIDRPARAHHGLPPARLAGDRMRIGHVLVAGECMAHQDGIAALRIERSISLVGDLERRELDAGIELERTVGTKSDDQGARLVGFAHAVDPFARHFAFSRPQCRAYVGHGHLLTPHRHGGLVSRF